MAYRQAHLIIRGRVQGVYFRASTRETALALGLTGWVRNLPDGNVEAVFEGPEDMVRQAVTWCQRGPSGARVADVEENWLEASGLFSGFNILYR